MQGQELCLCAPLSETLVRVYWEAPRGWACAGPMTHFSFRVEVSSCLVTQRLLHLTLADEGLYPQLSLPGFTFLLGKIFSDSPFFPKGHLPVPHFKEKTQRAESPARMKRHDLLHCLCVFLSCFFISNFLLTCYRRPMVIHTFIKAENVSKTQILFGQFTLG